MHIKRTRYFMHDFIEVKKKKKLISMLDFILND